jgi:hypothetical protein
VPASHVQDVVEIVMPDDKAEPITNHAFPTPEALLAQMMDWVEGRRSWTNLGPYPPYTPDVIAVLDAQEVVKLSAAIQAFIAYWGSQP